MRAPPPAHSLLDAATILHRGGESAVPVVVVVSVDLCDQDLIRQCRQSGGSSKLWLPIFPTRDPQALQEKIVMLTECTDELTEQ